MLTSLGRHSETPLNTICIVAPPTRHVNDLPCAKAQEYRQHIKVEPGIKSCRKNVIIPSPKLVMVSVCPIHHNEAAYNARDVASGDVAPKVGHRAEEYSAVPKIEFCVWEYAMEGVEERGCQSANEEGVWEGLVDDFGEQPLWSLRFINKLDQ